MLPTVNRCRHPFPRRRHRVQLDILPTLKDEDSYQLHALRELLGGFLLLTSNEVHFTSATAMSSPAFIMPERLLAHALKHSSRQPHPHFLCSHTLRIQNVLAFGDFLLRYDHNKGKSDCCFAAERQPKSALPLGLWSN